MQGPKTTLTWKIFTETDDGVGGYTHSWNTVKDVSGTLATLSDREIMMYGKKAEGCDYKFVIDYIVGQATYSGSAIVIATKDRLYSGSRIFEINGMENPMSQNRCLILLLSENVDG